MTEFKSERHERIYKALLTSEEALDEESTARIAEIAADAAEEAHEGYPKGAGAQSDDAMVAFLVTEKTLRGIEHNFLKPRGLSVAGPLLFCEDDTPSYILSV